MHAPAIFLTNEVKENQKRPSYYEAIRMFAVGGEGRQNGYIRRG